MLSKLDLVVIRWTEHGYSMSKPCKHCIDYLTAVGIRRVYYSDERGNIIYEKTKNITNNHICAVRKTHTHA